ncbi:MAG: helix-turn-helix domain-containing protein [Phycisphaerales bacterium]|nr:helix-turn-helix domain-containing protein [Phycisphaerales bacterium]
MAKPKSSRGCAGSRSSADTVPTGAVFTIDDLVVYLKLPKSTVYKLAQEGKIPGRKVGKHWRFHRDTIDHWLKQRTE